MHSIIICIINAVSAASSQRLIADGFSVGVRGDSRSGKLLDYRTITLNAKLEDINGSGWRFCFWDCRDCDVVMETAPLHVDCFRMFRRAAPTATSLDYLWWKCSWRSPYRHSMNIPLAEPLSYQAEQLSFVSAKYGLAWLQNLPSEIILVIHSFCEKSSFWGLVKALEAAAAAKDRGKSSENTLTTIDFGALKGWTRGFPPVLKCENESLMPIVEVVFDAVGLSRIKRLPVKELAYSPSARSDSQAYIFEHEAEWTGAELYYKDGFGRVALPSDALRPLVWDTSTPPDILAEFINFPSNPSVSEPRSESRPSSPSTSKRGKLLHYGRISMSPFQVRTLHLCSIHGLTLEFSPDGDLFQIHGHTAAKPITERLLYHKTSDGMEIDTPHTAIYVPLPTSDQLRYIAAGGAAVPLLSRGTPMEAPVFVFEMQLAGKVHVGRWLPQQAPTVLVANKPTVLVHSVHQLNRVERIGLRCASSRGCYLATARHPTTIPRPPSEPPCALFYSSAPLAGVRRATVFTRPCTRICRGALLEYSNGAKRTVGECRLGWDDSKTYDRPVMLCKRGDRLDEGFVERGEPQRDYYIEFAAKLRHTHASSEKGWKCFGLGMDNTLVFCFGRVYTNVWVEGKEELQTFAPVLEWPLDNIYHADIESEFGSGLSLGLGPV